MTYTDINGTAGDDVLYGTAEIDYIRGFAGNDTLDGGDGNDSLYGFAGNDTLRGGNGDDYLDGDTGVDTLTGGWGKDSFVFFNNSGSSTTAPNGIRVLNQPDIVTDFQFGEDKLIFGINGASEEDVRTGIVGKGLKFDKGVSSQLSGDENLLVLTDPFANAAAAAKAIADNNAITSDEGLFVYFNTTLGIARFVHSQDLSDGGSIDVLANLSNVTDPASINNFSAQDFSYFVLT